MLPASPPIQTIGQSLHQAQQNCLQVPTSCMISPTFSISNALKIYIYIRSLFKQIYIFFTEIFIIPFHFILFIWRMRELLFVWLTFLTHINRFRKLIKHLKKKQPSSFLSTECWGGNLAIFWQLSWKEISLIHSFSLSHSYYC